MGHMICKIPSDSSRPQALRRILRRPAPVFTRWYWTLLSFVGVVSVYDAYLTYVFRYYILDLEENPMGLMLIRLDPKNLSYFLVGKTAGTTFVLLLLAAAECAGTPGRHATRQFLRSHREYPSLIAQEIIRLNRLFRRYRQTILSGVATFQLWLLWYLTT